MVFVQALGRGCCFNFDFTFCTSLVNITDIGKSKRLKAKFIWCPLKYAADGLISYADIDSFFLMVPRDVSWYK